MTTHKKITLLTKILTRPESAKQFKLGDWQEVLHDARHSSMVGKLYSVVWATGAFNSLIPDHVSRHLRSEYIYYLRQKQQVQWEIRQLKKVAIDTNTNLVLLKGAAYFYIESRAGNGRTISDIDIIVRKDEIKYLEKALFVDGWMTEKIDDYDKQYYREWAHEIAPLRHYQRGTVLDLHHNIFPPLRKLVLNSESLLENAVFHEDRIGVLQLEDLILHSATHLFWEGEFDKGYRDLFDLYQLFNELEEKGMISFPSLVKRAEHLGLVGPLFLAQRYCQKVFDLPSFFSPTINNHPKAPKGLKLLILDLLFLNALQPHTPANLRSTRMRFSLTLLYLRGHYIKMPLNILIPHLIKKTIINLFKKKQNNDSNLN